MSVCSSSARSNRTRIAVLAAATAAVAANIPAILHHTGASDWTDAVFGAAIGLSLGVTFTLLIFSLRRRSHP